MDEDDASQSRLEAIGKVRLIPQTTPTDNGFHDDEDLSHLLANVPFLLDAEDLRWWIKVIEMLQQNWAIPLVHGHSTMVLFVDDLGGVFDRIDFADRDEMIAALRRNGFEEYDRSPSLKQFLAPPKLPFRLSPHANGRIYSSGRFWVG